MKQIVLLLGIIGALLYSNWLLGYWLNSRVAIGGLASNLQIHGQPYSWVFVLGDVLSGLVITVAAYFIYMISQQRDQLTVLMIGGYLCFGVLTAISALLPLHCGTNPSQCAVNNFQPLGIHDAIGGVASFGQFISLIAVWRLNAKLQLSQWFKWLTASLLLTWSASGILYLVLTFTKGNVVLPQHIFLALTFIGIIIVPLFVFLERSNLYSGGYNSIRRGGKNEGLFSRLKA
jgi:hypothetical protein